MKLITYNLKIVAAFDATCSCVDCARQRYSDATAVTTQSMVEAHNLLIYLDSWYRATRSSNVD